ncbi:hypothetical protein [Acidisphaera sp. L21]|uniref:hypothetical protein n=1 Tax=Acidisphaera sp. L21 TaxID=1641851 RepID=UPI00131ADC79|nr:hypothetical protein [Acidisphaera sp. L21]
MRTLPTVLLALSCTLPGLAWAQDDTMCRQGNITTQSPLGVARIVGGPRTYLRSDTAPCPNDSAACQTRVYVVPGDTVLTGRVQGRYICALFAGKAGSSAGYVLQSEIAARPLAASPLAAWSGAWHDGDNTISLKTKGAQLVASGEAYWPSANPSLKERPGGPNLGQMSGAAAPRGNKVVFADTDPDGCQVTMTLVPPYLAVSDTMNCGGMNVTFTGTYTKR